MKKTSKKTKSPAGTPRRKVAIKDLKAKDAGSVKGGSPGTSRAWDLQTSKKI